MLSSLRESKARLSELVALAHSGEDVVITVRGRPKAKLVAVAEASPDKKTWLHDLAKLRTSLGKPSRPSATSALDDVRSEKW